MCNSCVTYRDLRELKLEGGVEEMPIRTTTFTPKDTEGECMVLTFSILNWILSFSEYIFTVDVYTSI